MQYKASSFRWLKVQCYLVPGSDVPYLGQFVPWMMRPFHDTSLTDVSWPLRVRLTIWYDRSGRTYIIIIFYGIQFELGSLANPNWFLTASTVPRYSPGLGQIGHECILHGTHHPRDTLIKNASSKGRLVQGTGHLIFFVRGHPGVVHFFMYVLCKGLRQPVEFPPKITPRSNPTPHPPPHWPYRWSF